MVPGKISYAINSKFEKPGQGFLSFDALIRKSLRVVLGRSPDDPVLEIDFTVDGTRYTIHVNDKKVVFDVPLKAPQGLYSSYL